MNYRKKFKLMGIMGILLGLLLPACSLNSSESKTPQGTQSPAGMTGKVVEPASDTQNNKTEITLWHYYTTKNGENFEKMIGEYNALPGSKALVKLELIPRNELLKKYTLGVGSGDLPDIAITDNPDTASLAAMGMFIDVSERFKNWDDNRFMEGPLKSGEYKGLQYALPLRSNCLALWVNNEHMEKAKLEKLPETWPELLEASEKLKAAKASSYPLAFSAVKSEEGVFQFMPFFLSTGATIQTADSEAGTRAFNFYAELAQKQYISSECINWTQNDVEKQFAAGNASMMVAGPWQIPNVTKDAPELHYTLVFIPKDERFASVLGGENIGITKATKDPEACWDFLKFILGTEQNVRFNTLGGTISPHSNITPKEQYPNSKEMQVFIAQLEFAQARGPHPKWPEISGAFQDGIQQVLTGAKTPAAAARSIAEKVKKIDESLK